ncbi:hypothetical protein ACFYUV_49715 [Nonomuraea sp. NPDC003560]|uniref:hypothetical protein n=1 Tax=Nonomuraea sp. NPDC003560 TaxID=3364341 RepID=UPI0036BB11BA
MDSELHLPHDVEYVNRFGFSGRLDQPDHLSPPYDVIHNLAKNAPQLLRAGDLGEEIARLPIIEAPVPADELELFKMAYSFLVQAYVWEPIHLDQSGLPRTTVPMQLAKPLISISAELDEPPTYLYSDHTIRNSRLIDSGKPAILENLKSVYTFSGTSDENQFVVVHTAYEQVGLPAVRKAISLMTQSHLDLSDGLDAIAATIEQMRHEFLKVKDVVSPKIFQSNIRLYLMGWRNNLPSIRFEGARINASELRGETGSGSALLPFFDRFMSIMHDVEQADENENLQTYWDFDKYRPKWHRSTLEWVAASTRIREKALQSPHCRRSYNRVVEQVARLREAHLHNVGIYLRGNAGLAFRGNYGTGGSNFATYLHALVVHNRKMMI